MLSAGTMGGIFVMIIMMKCVVSSNFIPPSMMVFLLITILTIERRKRNFLQNLESREEKEKWV